MADEITLHSEIHDSAELRKLLEDELTSPVALDAKPSPIRMRGVDQTILVAAATGASHVLVALINALIKLREGRRLAVPATIVVHATNGRSLEFPANLDPARVAELVKTCEQLDAHRIEILKA